MENCEVYCSSDKCIIFHNSVTGVMLKVDLEGGGYARAILIKTMFLDLFPSALGDQREFYEWIMFWGDEYILAMRFFGLPVVERVEGVELGGLYKLGKEGSLLFVDEFFWSIKSLQKDHNAVEEYKLPKDSRFNYLVKVADISDNYFKLLVEYSCYSQYFGWFKKGVCYKEIEFEDFCKCYIYYCQLVGRSKGPMDRSVSYYFGDRLENIALKN